MVNNNCGGMIFLTIFGSEALLTKLAEVSAISMMPYMLCTTIVVGTISFIVLIKDDSKKKKQAA